MTRCRGSICIRRCPKEYNVNAPRKSRLKATEILNLAAKMDQKVADSNSRGRSSSLPQSVKPKPRSATVSVGNTGSSGNFSNLFLVFTPKRRAFIFFLRTCL